VRREETLCILSKSVSGWKPYLTFVPTSSSSISFLAPAGLENATGLISSSNQKDFNDVQWTAGVNEFFAFMKQYLPNADVNNSNYAAGYHYASLLVSVLKACKDFSRENIMRQAASLREIPLPLLLPGITVTTGADDYLPFQQLRLRRSTGQNWVGFGELLDDR
jgi:branched-chain amino acid transport system substrate-binding protein